MQDQPGGQLGLQFARLLPADLAGHQQRQPAAVPVVVEQLVVGLDRDDFRSRPASESSRVRAQLITKSRSAFSNCRILQRHLIGHLVLRQRLALAVHDHAARRGNLQRDGARVLAGDDRPVGSTARDGGLGGRPRAGQRRPCGVLREGHRPNKQGDR